MSRRPSSLRKRQAEFLRALIGLDKPITAILKDLRIDPTVFVRWLNQPRFRERLADVRRYLVRTRELHVDLAALHASAKLIRSVRPGRGNAPRIKPGVELIRLARGRERRRAATGASAAEPDTTPLYHPQLPAGEAERLIRELAVSRASS